MTVEAMKKMLKEAKRNERHRTVAETRYWLDQYRLIAEKAVTALEQAQKQEPVAWMEMVVANLVREGVNKHKARELAQHFYTLPPKREWVELTNEEIDKTPCELYAPDQGGMTVEEGLQVYARAIEAKLKEKNT